jgi:hypothetical protein
MKYSKTLTSLSLLSVSAAEDLTKHVDVLYVLLMAILKIDADIVKYGNSKRGQ